MRAAITLFLFLLAAQVMAQGPPRRTECLQWDQAYGQAVLGGVGGTAVFAVVAGLTIGFAFGRQFWFGASPRTRVWVAGGTVFVLAVFLIVAWPRMLPLGKFPYASVDPRYADCQTIAFGAPGILHGWIGEGVAAYAQWLVITLLLAGSSGFGTLVAWILSEAILRGRGLEAMARAGGEG